MIDIKPPSATSPLRDGTLNAIVPPVRVLLATEPMPGLSRVWREL